MSEFEGFDSDLTRPITSEAEKKGWTREQAIDFGRRLGADEARRRHESPEWADSRVKRAMAYAAWEFDGKPVGRGTEYRKEFGIPDSNLSVPQVMLGSDFKGELRKRVK